jgi:hypothetical protein
LDRDEKLEQKTTRKYYNAAASKTEIGSFRTLHPPVQDLQKKTVEKIYAKFPRALPLKISHFLSCFVHTPISKLQAINKGRKQREVETSSYCTRKKEEKTRPRTRRARASLK